MAFSGLRRKNFNSSAALPAQIFKPSLSILSDAPNGGSLAFTTCAVRAANEFQWPASFDSR
jgi:hypothetical protein